MIEHERKFLVDQFKWRQYKFNHAIGAGFLVEQFYTPETINGFEVRFRTIEHPNSYENSFNTLTLKKETGDPEKRIEHEFRLTSATPGETITLMELIKDLGCEHLSVRKRRVQDRSFAGHVDEYYDGLIIYEIENPPEGFVPPDFVVEEVTNDPLYRNRNLVGNS